MKSLNMVPISEYVALKMEADRLTELVENLTQNLVSNAHIGNHLEKGIVIGSNGQSKFVKISEIVMIKAESNYSSIYLSDGQCLFTSKTLKYWAEKCNVSYLIRLHKTYLVNISKITDFELSTGKVYLQGDLIANFSKAGKKELARLR